MMKLRYRIFLAVFTWFVASPSTLGVAIAGNESVVRLISAMKADQADLLKLRLAVELSVRDGKGTQEYLDCVKSFSTSSFTSIYAKTFEESLSSDEIDDAIAFFEQPLGRKFIARRFALAYRVAGNPNPEPVPSYSESELQELRVIAKRAWGEKLMRYTLVRQPAHTQAVEEKTDELLRTCSGR
jgi:hypothetical protein